MGTITRHSNAPFADGETLSGTELEQDFATIYTEFNGSIDNANIKAAAAIAGSKIAALGIDTAQLAATAVTLAKMAAAAVPKVHTSHVAGSTSLTSTSVVDEPNVTAATLTPGSTSDLVVINYSATFDSASSPSANTTIELTIDIDGSDTVIGEHQISNGIKQRVSFDYAVLAADTNSTVYKPQWRLSAGSNTQTVTLRTFTVYILPAK